MSVFRRMLLIAKLSEDVGGDLVVDFTDGVVTLNEEGNGSKTTINDGEVTLSE